MVETPRGVFVSCGDTTLGVTLEVLWRVTEEVACLTCMIERKVSACVV